MKTSPIGWFGVTIAKVSQEDLSVDHTFCHGHSRYELIEGTDGEMNVRIVVHRDVDMKYAVDRVMAALTQAGFLQG